MLLTLQKRPNIEHCIRPSKRGKQYNNYYYNTFFVEKIFYQHISFTSYSFRTEGH